jgi:hypothetical protein
MAVDADALESAVVEMTLAALDGSNFPAVAPDSSAGDRVAAVELELEGLARLRGEGTISMGEWLAAREPLLARLEAAKTSARPTRPEAVNRLLSRAGAARAAWPELTFAAKRAVLEAVIAKVVVGPATRARWTTIEERLDPDQGLGVVWKV